MTRRARKHLLKPLVFLLAAVAAGWAAGYIFQSYGVYGFYSMTILAGAGIVTVAAAMLFQPQSARSGG